MAKKVVVMSATRTGTRLNIELTEKLNHQGYECVSYATPQLAEDFGVQSIGEDSATWTKTQWQETDLIIYISSIGRVIQAIAPCIGNDSNTTVLVIDEVGQYVIPILAKISGNDNIYAGIIAKHIGAVPVLTNPGATVEGKFGFEQFIERNGLETSEKKLLRQITAAIIGGRRIGLFCEYGMTGKIPEELALCKAVEELKNYDFGVAVMQRKNEIEDLDKNSVLYLLPRDVVVGIDYQSNMSWAHLREQVTDVLQSKGISYKEIEKFVSIDSRKEDSGINTLARRFEVPFVTYSTEELRQVGPVSKRSIFTKTLTGGKNEGVDMVCERAAILGSGQRELLLSRIRNEGVEIAFAAKEWTLDFEEEA